MRFWLAFILFTLTKASLAVAGTITVNTTSDGVDDAAKGNLV